MARVPAARPEVETVASPPTSGWAVSRSTPSTLNWTVPVGVPTPAVTVALNVTLVPYVDGLAEEATAVVVTSAVLTVNACDPCGAGS